MGKLRSLFHYHGSKHQHNSRSTLPPSNSSVCDLKRVFNKFDSNSDDKISSKELVAVLDSLGHPPSEEEHRCMMREVDTDSDGFILFDEFAKLNAAAASPKEDLRLAFVVFNLNCSGTISAEELTWVLCLIGEGASVAQCCHMIEGVDRNDDGAVSFEEFKTMMPAGGECPQA